MTKDELFSAVQELFGSPENWPLSMRLLRGVKLVDSGTAAKEAARMVGTTERRLIEVLSNPVQEIIGIAPSNPDENQLARKRDLLGQILLGKAAELAFENIYTTELGTSEFKLDDRRGDRSDTDYRMLNGSGRQFCRINIKFFGSLFRQSLSWVGLQPEDCFPLATYKIHGALRKQTEEHLPYLFLVINVPNLTARTTSDSVRPTYVRYCHCFFRKSKGSGTLRIASLIFASNAITPNIELLMS